MKKNSIILAFLFTFSFLAKIHAQPQDFNLTQISNLPYTQDLNDIWGYADETGVEYALVGTQTGTSIVSLATPASPVEVLFIPGFQSVWRDLKTWGDFAYVTADQGSDGLLIIDLSPLPLGTPTYQFWKPSLTVNGDTDILNKAHNLYIDEAGYAYIAGSNINAGETFILDVHTTPGTPIYQGATLPIYAHDAYARGDTLWTSDINAGTFSVYDISNKSAPVRLADQTTPKDFCHNAWISDDGNTLFTTDEKADAWVAAYDVSDLNNIVEIDRWKTPNASTIPHNTHTHNDYLVTSYYTDGVIVIDASRPDNLIEVGRFDSYHGTPSTGFYGCWGAYPYLPSGLVLISDINTGLHVLQPTYQRACWLEGVVTDQSNSSNLFDVQVKIISSDAEDKTGLSGEYKTGLGVAGTYSVEYKKAGYLPQTIQTTLVNGQVTIQNVQLVPANKFSISGQVVEDANPSTGVANAKVVLESSLYYYTATADANGNFSLQIYPDNDYQVVAGQWGYNAKDFNLNAIDSALIPSLTYPIKSGYKDEFVLDLGWSEFGNASTGKWERGIPENVYTWQGAVLPEEGDVTGDIGEYCLITGNNGNGTHGADDVDDGYTTIVSPVMDLSNANDPQLSFDFVFNKSWPPSQEDSFEVYMTNGIDTITLYQSHIPNYQWSSLSIRILDYITLSNNMRAYFRVSDNPSGTAVEALVDLFEITELTSITQTELNQNYNIHYYPNPFSNSIHLDISSKENDANDIPVQVYNSLGQQIEALNYPASTTSIDLGEEWNQGIYFISVGKQTIKVIKTK